MDKPDLAPSQKERVRKAEEALDRVVKKSMEERKRAEKAPVPISIRDVAKGAAYRSAAIIASLKMDLVESRARHAALELTLQHAADSARGGRAVAEYRLYKLANITLDLIGAVLDSDDRKEASCEKLRGALDLISMNTGEEKTHHYCNHILREDAASVVVPTTDFVRREKVSQ